MFTRKDSPEVKALRSEIAALMLDMDGLSKGGKEYSQRVKQLERLHTLLDNKKSCRVSPDTLAIIAGNALVALIIVAYEQKNVISTKAGSFMMKFR